MIIKNACPAPASSPIHPGHVKKEAEESSEPRRLAASSWLRNQPGCWKLQVQKFGNPMAQAPQVTDDGGTSLPSKAPAQVPSLQRSQQPVDGGPSVRPCSFLVQLSPEPLKCSSNQGTASEMAQGSRCPAPPTHLLVAPLPIHKRCHLSSTGAWMRGQRCTPPPPCVSEPHAAARDTPER